MKLRYYQVDAFTDRLFGGNPAGVCPLSEWLPAETMQKIAQENNQAETAFYVRGESRHAHPLVHPGGRSGPLRPRDFGRFPCHL